MSEANRIPPVRRTNLAVPRAGVAGQAVLDQPVAVVVLREHVAREPRQSVEIALRPRRVAAFKYGLSTGQNKRRQRVERVKRWRPWRRLGLLGRRAVAGLAVRDATREHAIERQ